MSTGAPLPADLWDSLPPEAQAMILALQAEVAELQAKIPRLQHRVEEQQSQVNRDTVASRAPPSPDPPPAELQPPRSPCEGVTALNTAKSPRDRLRELVHQSPRA